MDIRQRIIIDRKWLRISRDEDFNSHLHRSLHHRHHHQDGDIYDYDAEENSHSKELPKSALHSFETRDVSVPVPKRRLYTFVVINIFLRINDHPSHWTNIEYATPIDWSFNLARSTNTPSMEDN